MHRVSTVVFCNYTECLPGVSGVFRAGCDGLTVNFWIILDV